MNKLLLCNKLLLFTLSFHKDHLSENGRMTLFKEKISHIYKQFAQVFQIYLYKVILNIIYANRNNLSNIHKPQNMVHKLYFKYLYK